jgi:4-hydroxy-tetrahydrodipicolinate synthase
MVGLTPAPAAAGFARLPVDRLTGVFAAVLTPFDATLAPDFGLMTLHCRWLLAQGCDGLSVLGTTGEANSLAVEERIELLDHLIASGVPAAVLLPGTGCCALPDTVRLSAHAVRLGVPGVLMLPPFYYKNVSDDGVFAAYAETIERVGDARLRVYLYHFPQMSGVALTPALIERLRDAYPDTVVGIKDSSGDFAGMQAMVRAFPEFAVLSGSDEFLLPLVQAGGAGCITAVCNIAAALAADVLRALRVGDMAAATAAQTQLSEIRSIVTAYPLVAALKDRLAHRVGNAGWRLLRPPLTRLSDAAAAALASRLDALSAAVPAAAEPVPVEASPTQLAPAGAAAAPAAAGRPPSTG